MSSRKFCVGAIVAFIALASRDVNAILDIFTLTPGAALGGIVTGIIASTLGGISISIALGKIEFVDPPDQGYGQYRKKREALPRKEELKMEKLKIEKHMDEIYQKDQTQCIEKMVCNITTRFLKGSPISPDESDIMSTIEWNSSHGVTYRRMVMAQKVAAGSGDCNFLFDSCPLETSQMVQFIRQIGRKISIQQLL